MFRTRGKGRPSRTGNPASRFLQMERQEKKILAVREQVGQGRAMIVAMKKRMLGSGLAGERGFGCNCSAQLMLEEEGGKNVYPISSEAKRKSSRTR